MSDLTFIIPVRIDSPERLINLNLLIDHLTSNLPEASVFILEADKQCMLKHLLRDKRVNYHFIPDRNPVFFRTHYLNLMTKQVNTPWLAVWDTDIIISPSQIRGALKTLATGSADFIYPYDGRMLQVLPFFKEIYQIRKDISVLHQYSELMTPAFGSNSYGGGFMVHRKKYIQAGGENENIYGWGPEDLERVKRWQILGYKVSRIAGPAYHLYHPISANSQDFDTNIGCQNNRELFRICGMNQQELRQEVTKWPGNKQNANLPSAHLYIK